jgi:cytochrome oxidase Cu insertion factor (SCO1/SenC/PrrC family)
MIRIGYRIGFALIALGLLGMGILRLQTERAGNATANVDYGVVPGFSLVEAGGRQVTLQEFRGKVWIADFIFTSCAGMCPMMTSEMRKLQDSLPKDIRLVSFSVDPARDTPAVLNDYADHFGADRQRWSFVTGDRQSLYDLSIKGFKLGVDDKQGTEAEPITHSSRFVLVDKDARIRGYYNGSEEEDLKRLIEDARRLL